MAKLWMDSAYLQAIGFMVLRLRCCPRSRRAETANALRFSTTVELFNESRLKMPGSQRWDRSAKIAKATIARISRSSPDIPGLEGRAMLVLSFDDAHRGGAGA